jgi:hypothetical protein
MDVSSEKTAATCDVRHGQPEEEHRRSDENEVEHRVPPALAPTCSAAISAFRISGYGTPDKPGRKIAEKFTKTVIGGTSVPF